MNSNMNSCYLDLNSIVLGVNLYEEYYHYSICKVEPDIEYQYLYHLVVGEYINCYMTWADGFLQYDFTLVESIKNLIDIEGIKRKKLVGKRHTINEKRSVLLNFLRIAGFSQSDSIASNIECEYS